MIRSLRSDLMEVENRANHEHQTYLQYVGIFNQWRKSANADDPKAKEATAKLTEAQKLHDDGKHADSVKKANEALTLLGVNPAEKKQ